jgi:hypothetical protein
MPVVLIFVQLPFAEGQDACILKVIVLLFSLKYSRSITAWVSAYEIDHTAYVS